MACSSMPAAVISVRRCLKLSALWRAGSGACNINRAMAKSPRKWLSMATAVIRGCSSALVRVAAVFLPVIGSFRRWGNHGAKGVVLPGVLRALQHPAGLFSLERALARFCSSSSGPKAPANAVGITGLVLLFSHSTQMAWHTPDVTCSRSSAVICRSVPSIVPALWRLRLGRRIGSAFRCTVRTRPSCRMAARLRDP